MKIRKQFALLIFGLSSVCTAADFGRGYCVPKGTVVLPANAVVTIDDNKANGNTVVYPHGHDFFLPAAKVTLEGLDWGGNLKLEKTGTVVGPVIEAIFESHTHGLKADKQTVVCIATETEIPAGFTGLGSGDAMSCDGSSGIKAAEGSAEVQVLAAATRHCASLFSRPAQPLKVRTVDTRRGSCWAGARTFVTVEMDYICL